MQFRGWSLDDPYNVEYRFYVGFSISNDLLNRILSDLKSSKISDKDPMAPAYKRFWLIRRELAGLRADGEYLVLEFNNGPDLVREHCRSLIIELDDDIYNILLESDTINQLVIYNNFENEGSVDNGGAPEQFKDYIQVCVDLGYDASLYRTIEIFGDIVDPNTISKEFVFRKLRGDPVLVDTQV